jgi:hypothetical protein
LRLKTACRRVLALSPCEMSPGNAEPDLTDCQKRHHALVPRDEIFSMLPRKNWVEIFDVRRIQ